MRAWAIEHPGPVDSGSVNRRIGAAREGLQRDKRHRLRKIAARGRARDDEARAGVRVVDRG